MREFEAEPPRPCNILHLIFWFKVDVRAFLICFLSPSNLSLAYTLTISLIKKQTVKSSEIRLLFDYFPQRPLHFLKIL